LVVGEAPEFEDLDEATRVILFRALRELLMNVARDAKTGMAAVGLREQAQAIHSSVREVGVGFDVASGSPGSGQSSVQARIGSPLLRAQAPMNRRK
jgi:glucose-6-phosphate-specific signal transduction histidine kinase